MTFEGPSTSELEADTDTDAVVLAESSRLLRDFCGRSEGATSPNLLLGTAKGFAESEACREPGREPEVRFSFVLIVLDRSVVEELALPDRDSAARSDTVRVERLLWDDLW